MPLNAVWRRSRLAAFVSATLLIGCSWFRDPGGEPKIRRVQPDVAFEMMRDSPGLAVLDLREPSEYEGPKGHLPGARNIPLAELDRRLTEISTWRDLVALRHTTFLVYCRGGDACGEEGVRRLLAAGFDLAILLDGGIEAWSRAGYGVLGPLPTQSSDPTRGGAAPTHWRYLVDGSLREGGRGRAEGLFVPGRLKAGRFVPVGGVEGLGEFCGSLRRRQRGQKLRSGWMELRDGRFYADSSPREPARPYVRGCTGADGTFHPESRDVH